MQWLFLVRPSRADFLTGGPTPEEAQRVGEHFAYWKRMTGEGVALVVGRTQNNDERTLGLAIFRAEDEAAALEIAKNDPAVVHGVFTMELFPYFVALLGDPEPFRAGSFR